MDIPDEFQLKTTLQEFRDWFHGAAVLDLDKIVVTQGIPYREPEPPPSPQSNPYKGWKREDFERAGIAMPGNGRNPPPFNGRQGPVTQLEWQQYNSDNWLMWICTDTFKVMEFRVKDQGTTAKFQVRTKDPGANRYSAALWKLLQQSGMLIVDTPSAEAKHMHYLVEAKPEVVFGFIARELSANLHEGAILGPVADGLPDVTITHVPAKPDFYSDGTLSLTYVGTYSTQDEHTHA